ncbi:hypothetical protein P3X46_019121 [Hevea brasiliensis]|uniref:Reverse transcriptase zinc-binding domain-containing protein n=1 Tax=Hevea brasiliensis TaxID=3981 RepID=A0ABQ9LUS5_HEVBR|nr:hypothetical protein P3X46_019121 [Hevea brasiliensis]
MCQNFCSWCSAERETESHIFLSCKKSWLVWSWFQNWWDRKFWLNLFYAIVWSLWLARNEKVFYGVNTSVVDICTLTLPRLSLWMKALDPTFSILAMDLLITSKSIKSWTNLLKECRLAVWAAPPASSFKWNVDGSFLGKPSLSALGGVLQESSGDFQCIFSCPVGYMDSNWAELYAIRKALEIYAALPFLANVLL